MTQRKIEYYRKPHSIYGEHQFPSSKVQEEIVFHLIARILRLMSKFKMKSQENISERSARECATRLVSETKT